MSIEAVRYLENGFLKDYLFEEGITDISYNGKTFYAMNNRYGRKRLPLSLKPQEIGDFLRQIANLSEMQFSYQKPSLDVSFSRYRLNAMHSSVVRENNEKTFSFALRINSPVSKIEEDEDSFFGGDSKKIILDILFKQESIIIGGATGTGKTELQKWLLLQMKENTRVIVIDNVEELDLADIPHLDRTMWIVNDSVPDATLAALIKAALRNNPDWLMVAETRGKEALDCLLSSMSGHPVITTVHGEDLESLPQRLARLAMLSGEKQERSELLEDIHHHIRHYIYLNREERKDGSIHRYVESIGEYDPAIGKMKILYRRKP